MTATHEQIEDEAHRRFDENPCTPLAHYIIEVVREGWAPPEPVDPDLLAVREISAKQYEGAAPVVSADIRLGKYDGDAVLICALAAYKAGKAAR